MQRGDRTDQRSVQTSFRVEGLPARCGSMPVTRPCERNGSEREAQERQSSFPISYNSLGGVGAATNVSRNDRGPLSGFRRRARCLGWINADR
jgi:hypothetical protein